MPSVRLRPLGAVAALSAVLALSACGSDSKSDTEKTTSSGGGAFPVTIKSSLGTAEIPAAPKRVVTIGRGSAETAIALGHTPVGMEGYQWAAGKDGQLPWIKEELEKKGEKLPEILGDGLATNAQVDMEKIVDLEPDVILATWTGLSKEQFKALNDIAPTVAYPGQAWSIKWDEQIKRIGKALGEPKEAQGLIDGLEAAMAATAKKHPDYAKYTFNYIYTTPDTLGVFLPGEQRAAVVSGLGFKLDEITKGMPEDPGTDSVKLGYENADKLKNTDVIFTFFSSAEEQKKTMSNKLFASIPAIKKGAVVYSEDPAFVTASSMINPLTVPYTLKRYPKIIAPALKKAGSKT